MKNEGFSLVETLVVIAIIGIMSSIMTPKISIYLAKAKDTKVISDLSMLRTASQMYYLDEGQPLGEENGQIKDYLTDSDLEKIKIYFSGNINKLETSNENNDVKEVVGGSRKEKNGQIKLGGNIKYTFKGEEDSSDGINIWIEKDTEMGDYTINNYKWEEL
ncbi:MAG: prepilin-type N-terminal cleavage/methylation domain-containing protein [Fusobacterium sp. JB019]|nr:prepilin-type N-terminal cleavage/methylation domain-containing protein [Fusobacterium sp. JB019]